MSLQNSAVFCAIENRAPGFELAHSIGRFLRVQFSHAPLIDILTAAHGIGEVHLPIVAFIDVGQRSCDSALRHHRVRFTQERFADEPDANARSRSFNRSAQPRATSADHEHVVIKSFVLRHRESLQRYVS